MMARRRSGWCWLWVVLPTAVDLLSALTVEDGHGATGTPSAINMQGQDLQQTLPVSLVVVGPVGALRTCYQHFSPHVFMVERK